MAFSPLYPFQGKCTYGDRCLYAHGEHELRMNVKRGDGTVLCRYHMAGGCRRGAACAFAHGDKR